LPGPFSGPFEPERREEAIGLLEEIAEQVFADDLEDNFQHRGWLQQWRRLMPGYVEWQFRRAADYRVQEVELELTREAGDPASPIVLRGRIDRLDLGEQGVAVVDYKTGNVAKQEQILAGESVQLPFYALLLENEVARCEYLLLTSQKLGSQGVLEGEELRELTRQIGERLISLLHAIHEGIPLPAWGDERSCDHCSFAGICRRQLWESVVQRENKQ